MVKLLVGTLTLLVVGIIAVAGYWYLMSPSQGTVTNQDSVTKNTNNTQIVTSLNGITFRADIPPGYEYRSRAPVAPELESYQIIANRNHRQTISIYATDLKASQMTDDAAYILRASRPDKYQQGTVIIDGNPATTWTARDGSEQTIFSARDGKLLVVAVALFNQDQTHRAAAEQLVMSLRWQ